MEKRVLATLLAMSMVLGLAACGSKSDSKDDKKEETKTEAKADDAEDVELQVFIAASLSKVMDEVATEYQKDHPNVRLHLMQIVQEHCLHRSRKDMRVMYSFQQLRNRWISWRRQTDL